MAGAARAWVSVMPPTQEYSNRDVGHLYFPESAQAWCPGLVGHSGPALVPESPADGLPTHRPSCPTGHGAMVQLLTLICMLSLRTRALPGAWGEEEGLSLCPLTPFPLLPVIQPACWGPWAVPVPVPDLLIETVPPLPPCVGISKLGVLLLLRGAGGSGHTSPA